MRTVILSALLAAFLLDPTASGGPTRQLATGAASSRAKPRRPMDVEGCTEAPPRPVQAPATVSCSP